MQATEYILEELSDIFNVQVYFEKEVVKCRVLGALSVPAIILPDDFVTRVYNVGLIGLMNTLN